MSKIKQRHVVISRAGDPCPRCGWKTDVREHKTIRQKQLRAPFYYSRWFYCVNPGCKTTLIMPPEFIVWNHPEARAQAERLKAIKEQLGE